MIKDRAGLFLWKSERLPQLSGTPLRSSPFQLPPNQHTRIMEYSPACPIGTANLFGNLSNRESARVESNGRFDGLRSDGPFPHFHSLGSKELYESALRDTVFSAERSDGFTVPVALHELTDFLSSQSATEMSGSG